MRTENARRIVAAGTAASNGALAPAKRPMNPL
jgi:hypothetical protein